MTVTQVNRYIAFKLKEDKSLKGIIVSGEISNFKYYASSGHMYFTLKDNESSIKAVMFRSYASQLRFMPESGMKVIVTASVQVYEKDGVYQLYVSDMQPDGAGALFLACEQLKKKLSEEGIFNEEHKKPVPLMPGKIGIVTSLEATALQDMLRIISERFPIAEVTVFPALVQGAGAPASLCRAVKYADSKELDLLICGRGGGSFEDLMAFNDEELARCIYSCKTPIISAVGHETDTSVSDLAADLRAPTPSAAAEKAVPDRKNLLGALNNLQKVMENAMFSKLDEKYGRLDVLAKRLEAASPSGKILPAKEKLSSLQKRLNDLYKMSLNRFAAEIGEKAARLDSLSPLKTLGRGFSLVYKDEKLINSAKKVSSGDEVKIVFADGSVTAEIKA